MSPYSPTQRCNVVTQCVRPCDEVHNLLPFPLHPPSPSAILSAMCRSRGVAPPFSFYSLCLPVDCVFVFVEYCMCASSGYVASLLCVCRCTCLVVEAGLELLIYCTYGTDYIYRFISYPTNSMSDLPLPPGAPASSHRDTTNQPTSPPRCAVPTTQRSDDITLHILY